MSAMGTANAEPDTGYRFSWGLALAGGIVAMAVTFLVLMLGSGVGLLLMRPDHQPGPFLSGGAIYFFVAQAFGFAAGGHVTGRLLGPLVESHVQEEIRAALHGLVAWSVAVLAGLLIVAAAGATTAALYGVAPASPLHNTAVIVDRLFRPGPEPTILKTGAALPAVAPMGLSSASLDAGRVEAGRLIEADFTPDLGLPADDRARVIQLVQANTGMSQREASLRVAAVESRLGDAMRRSTADARKRASYTCLWTAFALLFGAFVAMVAAVTARLEDDAESPWGLFAFHRGWPKQ